MDKFLSGIIKFNTLYVLGIYRYDSHDAYYLLKIKKNGTKLTLLSQGSYTDIEVLLKETDTKQPFLVVIDGKGILNKKIDLNSETDLNWKRNIDFATLYYTEYKTEPYTFLSFSRKQNIDDVLGTLSTIQILDFYIGPLLSGLLYQSVGGDIMLSNESVLTFDDGVLQEISKAQITPTIKYTVGNDSISAYHLPLYAAAVNYYLKPTEIAKSDSGKINSENILYRKAFNVFGAAMLVLFFSALLSSYLLIQYYSSQNQILNQKNIFSNKTYQHIIKLQEQRDKKIKILNETGQMSKRFLTYYAYEFSGSVPSGVQLEDLKVSPVLGEIKESKKVSLLSNEFYAKGAVTDEANFDVWLKKLKSIKWISKFEILSLKKDKKNVQHFEIKIQINNV